MKTEILGSVEQVTPSNLGEGSEETVRMTKLGQLFTANWKERLLLAGRMWSITVGSVASGADVAEVAGAGGGVVDGDQPDIAIGVPAGFYLIPISCKVSAHGDVSNADADEANMVLWTSRAGNLVADGTVTTYTPLNCLDGGPSFPGSAFHTCTADCTIPACSQILDYDCWQSSQIGANGAAVATLRMNYEPKVPQILAGACSVYLCYGGTANKSGIGTLIVGCVPTTWFPVV